MVSCSIKSFVTCFFLSILFLRFLLTIRCISSSFSLLYNIPLYHCSTVYLSICLFIDLHWFLCLNFFLLWITLLWTFIYMFPSCFTRNFCRDICYVNVQFYKMMLVCFPELNISVFTLTCRIWEFSVAPHPCQHLLLLGVLSFAHWTAFSIFILFPLVYIFH